MKNNQLQKNIPNGWQILNFDQVVSQVLDFRGKTPLKLGMNWGGIIPALSANNVKKGYIDFKSECHMASEELYIKWMNKGDLKKGDVIFTMEAPLGNVAIIPDNKKYLLSQRVVAFRFSKEISSLFVYHYLLSDIFQGKLDLLGTGSTAKGINQRSLSKIKFLLPYLPEQNRIVSVLETWDRSIENLNKKIEVKKQIKKSLMQDLLTGKKRIGGFNDKWEMTKLGNIIDYKNGKSFENQVVENGKYQLITLNSLDINGDLKNENKTVNVNDNSLNKNDIIMILSDIAHGNFLGMTNVIPENDKYVLNQRIGALRPRKNINSVYISKLLNINQKYFKSHGHGSSQQNLSKGDILKFKINLPKLEEQNAIAEILITADKEITEFQRKLKMTKDQKKYLLNNLITGIIRTPETLSTNSIK